MASSSVVHDSTPARNHHPNSPEIGLGLDIADFILTALSAAAEASKIPYLQYAAQRALDIVTIIKVLLYFPVFSQSIIDQQGEDLGCQESQGRVQTIRERCLRGCLRHLADRR